MVYKSKLKRGNQRLSNETLKLLSNDAPEIGVKPLSHEAQEMSMKIASNDIDPATDIVPVNSNPQFKYNQKIAAILASVSGWSYADLDDFQRILSDDENINLAEADFVEITARNDSILIVAAAQIVRTSDKRTAVVCFRGTEPMNPVNWGTDLNVSQVPYLDPDRKIMVHRGFLDNFRSVWDGAEGILSYLKNPSKMSSDYNDDDAKESKFSEDDAEELENIYFTGHSLGGAMAFLAGLYTSCKDEKMWSKVRGIYTYGQPMVIHPDSANRCSDLIGDCLFRHVYFNDIVPHVPPRSMGRYAHIGREFRYRPHELHSWQEIGWGKVSQIPMVLFTLPFMLGDAAGTTITAVPFLKSPWSIIDHLPIGYMNSLNATSNENAPNGLFAVAGHMLSIFFPGILKDDDVRDPIITDHDENESDHTNDDDKHTNTIVGRLRNRRDKRVQDIGSMIEYRLKRAGQHGEMIENRIKDMISSTPQAEKLRNMIDFIEGKKARFVRARKIFHVLTIILVFYLAMLTISYY